MGCGLACHCQVTKARSDPSASGLSFWPQRGHAQLRAALLRVLVSTGTPCTGHATGWWVWYDTPAGRGIL